MKKSLKTLLTINNKTKVPKNKPNRIGNGYYKNNSKMF